MEKQVSVVHNSSQTERETLNKRNKGFNAAMSWTLTTADESETKNDDLVPEGVNRQESTSVDYEINAQGNDSADETESD